MLQEASLSDLSHILGSSEEVKKRRLMLLLMTSDEVRVTWCPHYRVLELSISTQAGREEHCDDCYDLCLLLNVTDLLATCCKGEFLQSEKVALELFSLEEILR